ncbi:MAG TPA: ABC transporter permease [Vicinamibacterales bacterium]|nr:ABC transporter permease [Vicinamibacterales bacterium]
MRPWTKLVSLFRAFFLGNRLDRELDAELASYVEELTARKIGAGVPPAEARRLALLETGGVQQVKEQVRDARAGARLDQLLQDVRVGVRMLGRSPGFTLVAVATMALGIGANTAIFSVVDAVLLRPAPFRELDRLAMVWETDRDSGTTREPASLPDYLDFRSRTTRFEALAALAGGEVNLVLGTGNPVRLAAMSVTREFLPMVGLQPIVGRAFTAGEETPGGPDAVLIAESLWERGFGRDPAAVGRTLRLDERPHTIVGVLPDGAGFGALQILQASAYARGFADREAHGGVDVWLPLRADVRSSPRETHGLLMLGRLGPGATVAAAGQETAAIAGDLERAFPSNAGRGTFVEPLAEVVFGPVRPALLVLLGAVGLVLLVASVNVANLLLARGAARRREAAIRTALGAGAGRLCRQFLTEGLVLMSGAALVGAGVAHLALEGLLAIAPGDVPRLSLAAIDLRVLGATLALSMVVGLFFGLVPTLQARRLDVRSALEGEGGRHASPGRAPTRLRAVLVAAEVALAVMLVLAAGLLLRSFWQLWHVDPGFGVARTLKAEYQLPQTRYPVDFAAFPDFKEMHAFTAALLRSAAARPGVEAAAAAGNHPLDPGFTNSFVVVGREAEARAWPEISVRRVTPGYFATVGLARIRGRLLEDRDGTTDAPVLLVNEAAAARFFPAADPLGARVRFWGTARTVVGIVANERIHGLAQAPPPCVYLPLSQAPSVNGAGVLLVRTSGDPAAMAASMRAIVRDVDPELAVFGVEPLAATLSRSVSTRRFTMMLVGTFALVALALAAIGIHGVLSYGVTLRTREIGVRMALGAGAGQVLRLVLREGAILALAGLALGLAGALALTRVLESLLFGVSPTDPATIAAISLVLMLVALAASGVPAWRATRIDPVVAMRGE